MTDWFTHKKGHNHIAMLYTISQQHAPPIHDHDMLILPIAPFPLLADSDGPLQPRPIINILLSHECVKKWNTPVYETLGSKLKGYNHRELFSNFIELELNVAVLMHRTPWSVPCSLLRKKVLITYSNPPIKATKSITLQLNKDFYIKIWGRLYKILTRI